MEHILHFFGGGCGEHLILPALISGASGAWVWVRVKIRKDKEREQ